MREHFMSRLVMFIGFFNDFFGFDMVANHLRCCGEANSEAWFILSESGMLILLVSSCPTDTKNKDGFILKRIQSFQTYSDERMKSSKSALLMHLLSWLLTAHTCHNADFPNVSWECQNCWHWPEVISQQMSHLCGRDKHSVSASDSLNHLFST